MKRLSITLFIVLLTALLYFTVQAKDHIITDPVWDNVSTQTHQPPPMITVTPGVYPSNPTFIPRRAVPTIERPDYVATMQAGGIPVPGW